MSFDLKVKAITKRGGKNLQKEEKLYTQCDKPKLLYNGKYKIR